MKAKTRNPGELLAQRVYQQQREVAEARDRARHVAQHDEFRARRAGFVQHQVDRHAAGGHRLAQRLAQIDRSRAGAAPPGGQPGRQGAGQRGHHPAHLAQLLTRGTQKLDVLGKLWNSVHLDVLAAELLGCAPLGLGVDHSAQLRDLLCGKRFGNLFLGGCGLIAVGSKQARQ